MRTVVDRAVETFMGLTVSEVPEFLERTNLTHNHIDQYAEAMAKMDEYKSQNETLTRRDIVELTGYSMSTVKMYEKEGYLTNVAPPKTRPRYVRAEVEKLEDIKLEAKRAKQEAPSGVRVTKKATRNG